MISLRRPQIQAAAGYFVYGVVYLSGAIRELDDSRRKNFFGDLIPWWVFYVAGVIFLFIFPVLVAKGYRWIAALLAIFTAGKALYLFYRLGGAFDPFNLFFALIAAAATILLARAATAQ